MARRSPRTKTTKTTTTPVLSKAFRSGFEGAIALDLERRGVKFKYEDEELEYTYLFVTDFTLPNGVILEVKGVLDKETIRKLRAVKKQHPHRDIRLVFQRPSNRIHPESKMTYGMWADRNGFPWCGPNIPDSWLR